METITAPALPDVDVRPAGGVFGFDIFSDVRFTYLREPGDGMPMLVDIDEALQVPTESRLVKEWSPIPGKRNRTALFEHDALWDVVVGDHHIFRIDATSCSVTVSATPDPLRREMLLFGTPAAICMTRRGHIGFHGSAVEVDGSGVLFAAPGTFGKTTLAAAFLARGHRSLSDDLTCVDPDAGTVLPGPAVVRVRQDMAAALGSIDNTTIAYEDAQKVHLALHGPARGSAEAVPLKLIAILGSDDTGITLEPIDPTEALRHLWAVSFGLGDPEGDRQRLDRLGTLLRNLQPWNLRRPLRVDALDDVVVAVEEAIAST